LYREVREYCGRVAKPYEEGCVLMYLATLLAVTGDVVNAFAAVVRRLLADVQERLAYRAHIFIREAISSFVPLPSDLNYPARLSTGSAAIADSSGAAATAAGHSHNGSTTVSRTVIAVSQQDIAASPSSSPLSTSSRGLTVTRAVSGGSSSGYIDPYLGWYITLERTLTLLSKLYRCLEVKTNAMFRAFMLVVVIVAA